MGNTRLADRLKRQLRLQAAHAKQLAEVEAGGKREAEDDSKVRGSKERGARSAPWCG